MSPSPKTLVSILALGGLLLAAPADARGLRDDGNHALREQVARTIVRLLPTQPRPARRFAPVPVARDEQVVAVWLDRELIWSGDVDQLQGAMETFPFDNLDSDAASPPWEPHSLDGREICVGMAVRADTDTDAHLEEDVFEMDCDLVPSR